MSELEKMGRNLMDIALQYTHPNFEGMYPDWGAVCNIGEELVRMSDQPQLNENQQIVLDWLKNIYNSPIIINPIAVVFSLHYELVKDSEIDAVEAYEELGFDEEIQVLQVFSQWAQEQEEE